MERNGIGVIEERSLILVNERFEILKMTDSQFWKFISEIHIFHLIKSQVLDCDYLERNFTKWYSNSNLFNDYFPLPLKKTLLHLTRCVKCSEEIEGTFPSPMQSEESHLWNRLSTWYRSNFNLNNYTDELFHLFIQNQKQISRLGIFFKKWITITNLWIFSKKNYRRIYRSIRLAYA